MTDTPTATSQFTAFWLFARKDNWQDAVHSDWDQGVEQFASVLTEVDPEVTVRGVYSCMGLRADVDLIIWVHAPRLEQLSRLAVHLDQTLLGRSLKRVDGYIGTAGMSQYDPTHGCLLYTSDAADE